MATEPFLQAESALAELAEQFAQWRQTRQAQEPIPSWLWNQAVTLTALLPLSQVAKRLRLSRTDLKKHCLRQPELGPADAVPSPPAFMEVTGRALGVRPGPAVSVTLLEVERPAGARLRVHSPTALPVVAVLRAFLESPGCCN
jgi:hypothetical protein